MTDFLALFGGIAIVVAIILLFVLPAMRKADRFEGYRRLEAMP